MTTTDGAAVDEHFGRSGRFDVYDLDGESAVLVESRFLPPAGPHDERTPSRLDAVRDCAIVHVTSIGPSAAAQVVNAGIMPLKIPDGTPVTDVLSRLRAVLGGSPPPWLRKVMRRSARHRCSPPWSWTSTTRDSAGRW
ncbi:MAG TPA: NifB/NifX family molybdenum-iron cluster-binding protein [Kineosporiaceae bacterium]